MDSEKEGWSETQKLVWKNGEFIPWDKAITHIVCQGLHYGAAAFEGIRFYHTSQGPAVFRLKEHLERFSYSCGVLGMKLPYTLDELAVFTTELIQQNRMEEGYIRPIAWYSEEKLGLSVRGKSFSVAILVFPWEKKDTGPLRVMIWLGKRVHPETTAMSAKLAGTYNNSVLSLLDAEAAGFGDAILLDWKGDVAEATTSNIFMVTSDAFFTPPLGSILPGITRASIITLLRDKGFDVREENFNVDTLLGAREIFLCGTASEVKRVQSIDDRWQNKGIGIVTNAVAELYSFVVHGMDLRYKEWLTFVP